MDVTKDNFIELLPEITETIENCEFIAIDTELSGLMRVRSNNRFDLPEERFAKITEQSKGYFIMQFGLSCFSRISNDCYDNRTYNFYIFPQPNVGYGDVDRTFSIQAHAIQFLAEHNFDFNKLFKYGVSYLTYQEKQQLNEKLTSERQKSRDSPESPTEKEALVTAKGFLEVLELVIIHKKPLVGHNLHLDLIKIVDQFMEPLDDDYFAFKQICHSLFSLVYDTKHIAHSILTANSLSNNQSRLNDLFCQCRDSATMPKIKINRLNYTFDEQQIPHQAGYDAYMSGYCFLVLCISYLNKLKSSGTYKCGDENNVANHSELISEFANKVHLPFSYDYRYFNLAGEEQEPSRKHVFYVENPPSWDTDDYFSAFRRFGGIVFSRLNDTSALCALRCPSHIPFVIKYAEEIKNDKRNFSIHTYEKYLEIFKPKLKKRSS